jgi:hypothetical protein
MPHTKNQHEADILYVVRLLPGSQARSPDFAGEWVGYI